MIASIFLSACSCFAMHTAIPPLQRAVPAPASAVIDRSDAQPGLDASRRAALQLPAVTTGSNHVVSRSADGLFYVTATVNGVPIRFLVDTGASIVVLRESDAALAGIDTRHAAYRTVASTANGRAAVARVTVNELVVGPSHMQNINAAVVSDNLPVSLLGQNWLQKLSSLVIAGPQMTFN